MKKVCLICATLLLSAGHLCAQTKSGVKVEAFNAEVAEGDAHVEINEPQERLKKKLGVPERSQFPSKDAYQRAKKEWVSDNPDKHRQVLEMRTRREADDALRD